MSNLKRPRGIGSGDGGIWVTACDIDFTAQPNQTLAPDGDYVIDGVTFTKINTAHELAPMQIVNGTGLVITPDQISDNYPNVRTLPALTARLVDLVPNYDITTRVRAWLYVASGNWAAQYDAASLSFEIDSNNTHVDVESVFASGARGIISNACDGGSYAVTTSPLPDNVFVADLDGYHSWFHVHLTGTWAGSWPTMSALTARHARFDYSTVSSAVTAATVDSYNVLIGAHRGGSATAFVATFGAFKFEYQNPGA